MKKFFSILLVGLIIVTLLSLLSGCKKKKEVISCSTNKKEFAVVGYGKPAPSFIGGINFYCALHIPSNSTKTGQIDSVFAFCMEGGVWGFVYENVDNEYIFVTSNPNNKRKKIKSVDEFNSLSLNIKKIITPEFKIIDKSIQLYNVECVMFWWHSGGIYFKGFEKLKDGIDAVFDNDILNEPYDRNSGFAKFASWYNGIEEWPVVQSIERGE